MSKKWTTGACGGGERTRRTPAHCGPVFRPFFFLLPLLGRGGVGAGTPEIPYPQGVPKVRSSYYMRHNF